MCQPFVCGGLQRGHSDLCSCPEPFGQRSVYEDSVVTASETETLYINPLNHLIIWFNVS